MLLPLFSHRTARPLGYGHPMLLAQPWQGKKMCRPELLRYRDNILGFPPAQNVLEGRYTAELLLIF